MDDALEDRLPDDHRVADVELVGRLAAVGYTGPVQDAVDTMLVDHALPPLRRWQRDGTIFGRCKSEGRGITPHRDEREVLRVDTAERWQLADETAVAALIVFKRHGLRDNGWDPAGGRSLRSYFVTTCVREYPAVFRRWSGHRKRQPPTGAYGLDPPGDGDRTGPGAVDPAQVVQGRLDAERMLADLPFKIRQIVELLAQDYTQVEVARMLGISVRTVEDRMHKFRDTHRRPQ